MNQNNSSVINFYSLSGINNCIGENITNNMSDYSNKNNENNSRPNDNNEISFICKKRKLSEEKNKNKFSIFTPSKENNDLRRFINNNSSKHSNTISEQKRPDSLNKKEKQKKKI